MFISLSFIEFPFNPPKEWSIMKKDENLHVVQIFSGTLEYASIIDKFYEMTGKMEIVKVINDTTKKKCKLSCA